MAALPLHWQTIAQLSQQMHRGTLSPVDLMEHLLSRVEALLDGVLQAFSVKPRNFGR
jgi:Asp-tRNA(Asn)/Glu-tRNA(Gln) amidotransferase A subunit family amidase